MSYVVNNSNRKIRQLIRQLTEQKTNLENEIAMANAILEAGIHSTPSSSEED